MMLCGEMSLCCILLTCNVFYFMYVFIKFSSLCLKAVQHIGQLTVFLWCFTNKLTCLALLHVYHLVVGNTKEILHHIRNQRGIVQGPKSKSPAICPPMNSAADFTRG